MKVPTRLDAAIFADLSRSQHNEVDRGPREVEKESLPDVPHLGDVNFNLNECLPRPPRRGVQASMNGQFNCPNNIR